MEGGFTATGGRLWGVEFSTKLICGTLKLLSAVAYGKCRLTGVIYIEKYDGGTYKWPAKASGRAQEVVARPSLTVHCVKTYHDANLF